MQIRNVSLAVALWCFAMSTTLLLLSLWGRSVVDDRPALAQAVAPVSARALSTQMAGWLVAAAGDLSPAAVGAVEDVVASDPGRRAMEGLVGDLVEATDAEAGTAVMVDPRPHLRPLVPLLGERLTAAGVPVDQATLSATVESIDPLPVETGPGTPLAGSIREARRILRLATLAGVSALAVFGGAAVWLAEDRRRILRRLIHRVLLSALGFAVFLRLGVWVMDPRRGAGDASGTVREMASVLLGSSLHVPLLAAALAGAAALATRRRWRPERAVDRETPGPYSPVS